MLRRFAVIAAAVSVLATPAVIARAMPIPPSLVQGSGQVTAQVFVDATKPMQTRAGQFVLIALPANRTTGYSWSFITPPNATLDYVGTAYQSQPSGLAGSGGQEVWVFKAAMAGAVDLTFRYTRPFEPSTQLHARRLTFHVRVARAQ